MNPSRVMPPGAVAVFSAAVLLLAVAAPASGQGRLSNARVETRVLAGPLDREVRAIAARGSATWLGYQTPMIPGRREMCCRDSMVSANDCCGMCRLEGGGGVTMVEPPTFESRASRIALEPPSEVVILARIENRVVTRLRMFTPDCSIDGGGLPVVWLDKVQPAESVTWLAALVRDERPRGDLNRETRVVHQAVAALALHPDPSSLLALIAFARGDERDTKRQALFWLAQRAGQEAVAAISDALERDPDTEVKKRAVFALSQLPRNEGVPLLVQVARTNKNPEVRKQAMFWLGQTRDPRAVAFFEEILKARP